MKVAKALLIISFILWAWLIANAWGEDICFAPDIASRLVVELEQGRNTTEQNVLLEQAIEKCNSQIEICKEQKKQDREICDKEIKLVKPTIFSRMKDMLTGAGIAGIILIGVSAL